MKPRRVLCVGNVLCNDDGVALAVAARLREMALGATILEAAEFGLSCLYAFEGASQVVVVDAVATGANPGDCRTLTDLSFIPSSTCSIGHAISLASMLELITELGEGSVPRVSVVGIEAENLSPFGTDLSPRVYDAIAHAVELVVSELALPLN